MLSQKVINDSFNTFDWAMMRAELEKERLDSSKILFLSDMILRHTGFISEYPNKNFEKKRRKYFSTLCDFLEVLDPKFKSEITERIKLIFFVEGYYRGLLKLLDNCSISKRPANIRCSAAVQCAYSEFYHVQAMAQAAIENVAEFNPLSGVFVQNEGGRRYSVDAVTERISETLAMTLVMEAFKERWFDGDTVVLPSVDTVPFDIVDEGRATQILAIFWRGWKQVERRRRYLGGHFIVHDMINQSAPWPKHLTSLLEYVPPEYGLNDVEIYDKAANTRLKDRLIQSFLEMSIEHSYSAEAVGIEVGSKLPPTAFVSLAEMHANFAMSEILHYPTIEDLETPGGIRIIEWIRGFAVLCEISRLYHEKEERPSALIVCCEDLKLKLVANGLVESSAKIFMSNTFLHRKTRDMFDSPLIRIASNQVLIFTPALLNLNISASVLSNLSTMGADFGNKGKDFEIAMQHFFKSQGIEVFAFKFHRGDQEYEYDLVIHLDGYLFLFECKNYSLSGGDPGQTYYFDLKTGGQIRQVKRLSKALESFPEIIIEKMGEAYAKCVIIPCILHALPYARFGCEDGVYFTDASSVRKFFEDGAFRIKVPHKVGSLTVIHRTVIKQLWIDRPSAKEFLAYLDKPLQLELFVEHLDVKRYDFQLSETEAVLTYELVRNEFTTKSICEICNVDMDTVLGGIKGVANLAELARKQGDT